MIECCNVLVVVRGQIVSAPASGILWLYIHAFKVPD